MVIDFATKRLEEEIEEEKRGADNTALIRYWAAYLDGARKQKEEDAHKVANDLGGFGKAMAEATENLNRALKKLDEAFEQVNEAYSGARQTILTEFNARTGTKNV